MEVATVYYASTSRITLGGSLDLVGLGGQNLADGGDFSQGSTGGTLTAGNTTIVGSLQVAGQANFSQGVNIDKELRVGGSVLIQPATNQTSAFQVANASGANILNTNTSTTYQLVQNGNLETLSTAGVLKAAPPYPSTPQPLTPSTAVPA